MESNEAQSIKWVLGPSDQERVLAALRAYEFLARDRGYSDSVVAQVQDLRESLEML